MPLKYKDPRCQTISCAIGQFNIEKALLDLDSSLNLLPYLVYEQLGLGELNLTWITLQFVDRLEKHSKDVIEDVLVQMKT